MNNVSPNPRFPTCSEVRELAKPGTPKVLYQGQVKDTNVMLKLREEQPADERESFGDCRVDDILTPTGTP